MTNLIHNSNVGCGLGRESWKDAVNMLFATFPFCCISGFAKSINCMRCEHLLLQYIQTDLKEESQSSHKSVNQIFQGKFCRLLILWYNLAEQALRRVFSKAYTVQLECWILCSLKSVTTLLLAYLGTELGTLENPTQSLYVLIDSR